MATDGNVIPAGQKALETAVAGSSSSKKLNVELKKWNAVVCWSWDVVYEGVCPICRISITDCCNECQATEVAGTPRVECNVVWGSCNHAYHFHCITIWLEAHHVCPLDSQPWEFKGCGH